MDYPSNVEYDMVLGDNPYDQLHLTHFEYTFEGTSTAPWAFWTVAVYQHNWGLTDQRKSEYQISVSADVIGSMS